MIVGELMTRDVRTCAPTDSLNRAAQLMWEGDCGCVPVVDANGFVLGIITDRDICMATYTQGKPLHEIAVSSAISWQVFSCREDDDIAHAEALMQRHQVRRLPVTSFSGRLVGLLSLSDIIKRAKTPHRSVDKSLSPAAVALTVAAIGRPRHDKDVQRS